MKTVLLFFFLSSHVSIIARGANPVVVSESVGIAGDQVLTSREVQVASLLEKVLDPLYKNGELPVMAIADKKFASEVTALLLETVVFLEAKSFDMKLLAEGDLKAAADKVDRAVKGKATWESLQVSAGEERRLLERKLMAKAFIKFKTDSMSSIITDQEAQVYYDRNRMNFGNLPFSSFRESIKSYLAQQQLQERLRSWFEVIKKKYKVRNFLSEGSRS